MKKASKNALFDKEREILSIMHTNFEKRLRNYTPYSQYKGQINCIKTDIKGIISKMALASQDLQEIRSISEVMDSKLNKKVDLDIFQSKIQDIWKEFPNYTSYDNIKKVEQKIGKLALQ